MIHQAIINSPLGNIRSLANKNGVFYLGFIENEDKKITNLANNKECGKNQHLLTLENELHEYFQGKLKKFNTPIILTGTDFQRIVWENLKQIDYGHTAYYQELASLIGYPKAYRALGNANAKNPIAIVIPCHRVIKKNQTEGGYAWGIKRKSWLLTHESQFIY